MKAFALAALLFASTQCVSAQVVDPVAFYRTTTQYPVPSVLLKWQADINGDGKSEVFLSNKDDYDNDVAVETPAGWFVFFASQADNSFTESTGIQESSEDSIGIGGLAAIDLKLCFVGQVS